MSFTARIRLYLFAIALLPPALMIGVLYYYSSQQHETLYRRNSAADIERITDFRAQFTREVAASMQRAVESEWFAETVLLAERGSASRTTIDARRFGLDFLELIDDSDRVVASSHRPGLVGETLILPKGFEINDSVTLYETMEFDTSGQHPSFAYVADADLPFRLYGGVYMAKRFQTTLDQIIH
ncbi:MAG: hypothetical protein KKA42_02555, partial [candidate division Zixibacteria bacterium]|nr:hypothetical protein [candidate division Zixibacteria bacterium]